MASGGIVKGAAFERSVCKALSRWVSDGIHEDWFWRSAMSGGRSTIARRSGKLLTMHAGDICATAPGAHALAGRFYVECKCVKNLDLDSWIFRGTGVGLKFWLRACEEANYYGKCPMLIAKENITRTIMVLPCNVPELSKVSGEIAKAAELLFFDFEQILKQPFWFAHDVRRFEGQPTKPSHSLFDNVTWNDEATLKSASAP
jgi:hypothetical protein